MPTLRVRVRQEALDAVLGAIRSPVTIDGAAMTGGIRVERAVRRAVSAWAQRHPNKVGGRSSRHWDASVISLQQDGSGAAAVAIPIPGIGRALHPVDIRPVNASMIAFPVSPETYGMRARAYIEMHQSDWDAGKIFLHKDKAADRGYIARSRTKGRGKNKHTETDLLFILMAHVHQNRDPSMLPTDEEMSKSFAEGAAEFIAEQARSAT